MYMYMCTYIKHTQIHLLHPSTLILKKTVALQSPQNIIAALVRQTKNIQKENSDIVGRWEGKWRVNLCRLYDSAFKMQSFTKVTSQLRNT